MSPASNTGGRTQQVTPRRGAPASHNRGRTNKPTAAGTALNVPLLQPGSNKQPALSSVMASELSFARCLPGQQADSSKAGQAWQLNQGGNAQVGPLGGACQRGRVRPPRPAQIPAAARAKAARPSRHVSSRKTPVSLPARHPWHLRLPLKPPACHLIVFQLSESWSQHPGHLCLYPHPPTCGSCTAWYCSMAGPTAVPSCQKSRSS